MQGVIAQEFMQSIDNWFSSLNGGDISAIAIAVIGIIFLIAAAKVAIKIVGAVLGFAAVVYLVDPTVRDVIMSVIEKIASVVKGLFGF